MQRLYGDDCKIRLRPHHFPFTEPSAEVDVMCFQCHGKGCRMCKGEGYIELLGAGMVHPKVLEGCGIDSSVYSVWVWNELSCGGITFRICVCCSRMIIGSWNSSDREGEKHEFIFEVVG